MAENTKNVEFKNPHPELPGAVQGTNQVTFNLSNT